MPLIPRMRYAFLGCTLETGSKIIGLFYMVVYALCFLVVFFYYEIPLSETSDPLHDDNNNNSSSEATLEYANVTSSEAEMTNSTESYERDMYPQLDIRSTFFLEETMFIQMAFGAFLLYGIKLKNPDLVFSWILLQIALIWHSQIIILLNLIFSVHINTAHAVWFIMEEIALTVTEAYCMIVVYNYVLLLRNHCATTNRQY